MLAHQISEICSKEILKYVQRQEDILMQVVHNLSDFKLLISIIAWNSLKCDR